MKAPKTKHMFASLLTLLLAMPVMANTKTSSVSPRHTGQSPHIRRVGHGKKAHRTGRGSWKRHGQQQIDSERMREIQAALVRERYLTGEPTGVFDQRTKSALAKLQADQGWQTKVIPDSRALIKLGLGPSHEGALNLEANSEKSSGLLKSTDSLPLTPQR